MVKISKDSLWVQANRQVSCELDGEVVILNHQKGIYYGLDAVGTEIWGLLRKPIRVKELEETLLRRYEVEPKKLQRDILSLLRRLIKEGLVTAKTP